MLSISLNSLREHRIWGRSMVTWRSRSWEEPSPPGIPWGLAGGGKLSGGTLRRDQASEEIAVSACWERQDLAQGFQPQLRLPCFMGLQKSIDLLHWEHHLLGLSVTWRLPRLSEALAIGTQGEQRNSKNVCGYISHPAGCMRVVEGDRGHFSEAEIKLKCRKQSDISSTLQFVGWHLYPAM